MRWMKLEPIIQSEVSQKEKGRGRRRKKKRKEREGGREKTQIRKQKKGD